VGKVSHVGRNIWDTRCLAGTASLQQQVAASSSMRPPVSQWQ